MDFIRQLSPRSLRKSVSTVRLRAISGKRGRGASRGVNCTARPGAAAVSSFMNSGEK